MIELGQNSIRKNFVYNVLYQLLRIAIPLVTVPFLSRTLGAESIGVYSYSYTVANYFILFSMLGIENYGSKEVAKVRTKNLDEVASEIFSVHVLWSCVVLAAYVVYCLVSNSLAAWLWIPWLVASVFDVNWCLFGLEDFKVTTIRNSIIKVLSFVLILVLIKSPSDYWVYISITSLSFVLSQIVVWPHLVRIINLKIVAPRRAIRHFKPMVVLFYPLIAVTLYSSVGKVYMGILGDLTMVGNYEYAEKLVSIPLQIVFALSTVVLPHISNMLGASSSEEIDRLVNRSISSVLVGSIACSVCFIVCSEEIVELFLGSEFVGSAEMLRVLAVTIPIAALNNTIGVQYLIPLGDEAYYSRAVVFGCVFSLVITPIAIMMMGGVGAAGTVVATDGFVLFIILIRYRNINHEHNAPICILIVSVFAACAAACCAISLASFANGVLTALGIKILAGVLVYVLVILIYGLFKRRINDI